MDLDQKIRFMQQAIEQMAWHTHTSIAGVVGIEPDGSFDRYIGAAHRVLVDGIRCIVTAAHVIHQARSDCARFGVTTTRGDPPFELQGAPDRIDSERDLAAYFLPEGYPDEGLRFWQGERADLSGDKLATDILFVHGFPAVRSRYSALAGGLRNLSFPYGVMLRDDDLPEDLAPSQLAMDFDPENLRGPDGEPCEWLDPHGLSGSPVWRIGASGERADEWTPDLSLLVGVVTQWRSDKRILVATRWQHALEMFSQP